MRICVLVTVAFRQHPQHLPALNITLWSYNSLLEGLLKCVVVILKSYLNDVSWRDTSVLGSGGRAVLGSANHTRFGVVFSAECFSWILLSFIQTAGKCDKARLKSFCRDEQTKRTLLPAGKSAVDFTDRWQIKRNNLNKYQIYKIRFRPGTLADWSPCMKWTLG